MKIIQAITLSMIALVLFTTGAFAQNTVTVPWGDWLAAAYPIVGFVLLILLTAGLAILLPRLPPWVQAAMTPQIQAMLLTYAANALNWGIQQVAGATKGKELEIPVGNAVIAAAVQEALNTWPQKIVDKLGGVEGVKKFILQQAEDHGVIVHSTTTAEGILGSAPVRMVAGPQ